MLHYILHTVQIMLSPEKGWKDIQDKDRDVKTLLLGGLFPLAALVALSNIYRLGIDGVSFGTHLQQSVVLFVKYIFTYYAALYILSASLSRHIKEDFSEKRNATFVIYMVGVLLLIEMAIIFLPNIPMSGLLPLYTIAVIANALSYMNVDDQKISKVVFIVISSLTVILLPYFFTKIFETILPN